MVWLVAPDSVLIKGASAVIVTDSSTLPASSTTLAVAVVAVSTFTDCRMAFLKPATSTRMLYVTGSNELT